MPRHLPALAVALAALSLVACGGASGGDSAAPPTPPAATGSSTPKATGTDAAFLAQVEGICAAVAAAAPDQAPELTTPEQVQAHTAEFTADFATAQAAFAQLQFPSDDTGSQLRQVLVVDFGARVAELQSAKEDLDAAVAARDGAAFDAAARRIGAVGDAKLDQGGLFARSGLTTCDATIGPNA
jgi:hypothetical protein